jgi:inner membrane transporter RhtA
LNLKEFSVSTAPEVGRIIDILNLPSTVNFTFLSIGGKDGLYIDVMATNAQYIAQYQNKTLLFTLDDAAQ